VRRRLSVWLLASLAIHAGLVAVVLTLVAGAPPPMLFVDLVQGLLGTSEPAAGGAVARGDGTPSGAPHEAAAERRAASDRRAAAASAPSRPAAPRVMSRGSQAPREPTAVEPTAPGPAASEPTRREPVARAPEPMPSATPPPEPVQPPLEPPRSMPEPAPVPAESTWPLLTPVPAVPPSPAPETAPSSALPGSRVEASPGHAAEDGGASGQAGGGADAAPGRRGGGGGAAGGRRGSLGDGAGLGLGAREGSVLALAIPGDGSGASSEYDTYVALLRRRVQDSLAYPAAARRRELTGTVQVEIEVQPTGAITHVALASSSSHRVLDEAALEAVRAVERVPFPSHVRPRPLRVRLPVVFDLR
jgi:protein TonB